MNNLVDFYHNTRLYDVKFWDSMQVKVIARSFEEAESTALDWYEIQNNIGGGLIESIKVDYLSFAVSKKSIWPESLKEDINDNL